MANRWSRPKLYIPGLRRSLVARPRLSGRLSRGSDARLTLTSAPALTALLNELSAVPNDVHLVLDDYRLVDGPEIWSALISYCLRLSALAIRSA